MNRSQAPKSGRSTQGRAVVRNRAQGATTAQDATTYTQQVIDLLTADHARVKKLFSRGEKVSDDPEALQPIVEEACDALTLHAEIEEEFVYPAVEPADDDHLIAEARVEHNSAKQLIAELQSMEPDDERYYATFKVLGEYVKHHVKEEEGELFPLARKAKVDLEAAFEALSARAPMAADRDVAPDAEAGETQPARRARSPRADSRGSSRSGR
jgi:hemerythrin superfamily protein